jgi:hypothetical protein
MIRIRRCLEVWFERNVPIIIGLILALAIILVGFFIALGPMRHAQAQQMGVGIRVPWVCADGTMFESQGRCPKTIDPPVKVCPEEHITTMAQARKSDRKKLCE